MKRLLPVCADCLVLKAFDAQQAFVFFSLPLPNPQLPAAKGDLSYRGEKKVAF